MDRENGKRKATSPEKANGCSQSKMKKPNSPEATGETQTTNNANSKPPRVTDLTQKLVAMWVGGSHGHHPFMTQEVREGTTLRDAKERATEAKNTAQMLRNKIKKTEAGINDLKKSLKVEERIKAELISKMHLTRDLAATIMEHINYMTDTLQRCQQHKDHLSNMYNTIILKQKENYGWIKNREVNLQKQITDLRNTVSVLKMNIQKSRNSQEDKSNQMQSAYEAELTKLSDECEKTWKQLEEIVKEKKKMQSRLTDKESYNLELEKKIMKYEDGLKNLKEQVAKASAHLESIAGEISQLEKELADKNGELLKISWDLESATIKRKEQSVEISTIKDTNNELEKKINFEVYQRQSLAKSFEEASERSEELVRQVEKLKNEKEEAVREMKKKIESAETESIRILSEAKKKTDELEKKQESLLKSYVEKYETCLAEMKLLEAHHQSELSRVSTSSDSALLNLTTENRRLEEVENSLRREKNDLQVELQQIEDLLKKLMNSEKELRAKLDQCQAEAAKYVAAAATAQSEKKLEEDKNQEIIYKIKELEKEILNLQFNRSVVPPNQKPKSGASGDTDLKTKERDKKPPVSLSYKKSILKGDSKPRRTRSTPSSPVTVAPSAPVTSERKITFNFDSSPEGSPGKLPRSSGIINYMDSGDLFDDLIDTGKSSSQPMQSSQSLNSQRQPGTRKFFKSRHSQLK